MLNAEIRREEEGKIRITYSLANYETKFNVNLREHMDMLRGRIAMPQLKSYIEKTKMEQQEVKKALLKLKDGKQPGPNKIKGEIYKWMASSNTCVDGITKAMNLMMENG